MSNTVIRGGAPPQQVVGANAPGAFFQNLGSSPVFLGYSTGVSSGSFDGVIQPGGTYTSGPNRPVWLYADADAPIVWNDDSGATANQGTTVNASVSGNVGINGTVPVNAASTLPVAQQGIVTVQGTTKVQQMAQVQLLATLDFTCPTTGVIPSGTYDLTLSGLNNFASVLVLIDTLTSINSLPAPATNKALQGQFLWGPGTPSGSAEVIAYWHLARLGRLTDFIQLPALNDTLEVTFQPTAAPTAAVEYKVSIFGSNLAIPRVRYSQGGGNIQDPTQVFAQTYSAASTYFDYPGSTSGRFFYNLRCNSTAGASRLYPLAVPASQAISSLQYPVNTQTAVSFSGEFPGPLAPIALQTSVVTAGANAITCSAETV